MKIAPAYSRPGRPRRSTPRRAVGVVSSLLSERAAPGVRSRRTAANQEELRRDHAAKAAQAAPLRSPTRGRRRPRFDWATADLPVPSFTGVRVDRRRAARGPRPLHRLVPFLPRLGAARAATRRSSTTRTSGEKAQRALRRRAGAPRRDRRRTAPSGPRRLGLLPGEHRRRRHRALLRRRARPPPRDASPRSASRQAAERRALPQLRSPTSSRPARVGPAPTTSAPSPSRRGTGADELAARFETDARRLRRRSWSRRSPTVSPRPSPRSSTSEARAAWGYGQGEALSTRRPPPRAVPRHPPGAGLSRLPRPHREADALLAPRRRRRTPGITLTESFAMHPAASVSGLYFAHPEAHVLRRRPHRHGPGRGLRPAQGNVARRGRALARAEPRVRGGGDRGLKGGAPGPGPAPQVPPPVPVLPAGPWPRVEADPARVVRLERQGLRAPCAF